MRHSANFPNNKLFIVEWEEVDIRNQGHDPRSQYVETYWLGVLGPTATWILRNIANGLDENPQGFIMDLAETAHSMGVSGTGRHAPFTRALGRLIQFDLACMNSDGALAVRKRVPSLSHRHLIRMPTAIQQKHEFWQRQQLQTQN